MNKLFICLILSAFMFIPVSGVAQDTIIKRSGQQIIGMVVEVAPTEVKYKKMDFPDGPAYTELKSSIERIKYHGGHVDVFETEKKSEPEKKSTNDEYVQASNDAPLIRLGSYYKHGQDILKEREVKGILLSTKDPAILYRVKSSQRSKVLRNIGFVAIPLLIGSFVAYVAAYETYPTNYSDANSYMKMAGGLFICSAATFGTSIYFNINKKTKFKQAVKLYNNKYANHNVSFH